MDNQIAIKENNSASQNGQGNIKKSKLTRVVDCIFPYVCMSLFIACTFACMLSMFSVFPFGQNTMSSYDMLAQIAPVLEHFFDVFQGKSSLFYTYAIAGGADMFGTLVYCCVSPFTFIFLLFGDGNMYYATSIVLPLKMCVTACVAYYYLNWRFKSLPTYIKAFLSVCYAYCGYIYVANTYINWMDFLIYMPLLAMGFKRLVDGKGRALFAVALALCIYTCFSIASFSLFIIFPVAVAYCTMVVKKEKRKEVTLDLVLALCLAIAVSLPILLPSLQAFLVSGRRTSLFENLFKDLSADPLYKKVSYIFVDAFALVMTLAYFIKNGFNRPISRFLAVAAAFIFAPVIIDECCNLLNFGSYMSYSLRFGFLSSFYLFFCCALTMEEVVASDYFKSKTPLKYVGGGYTRKLLKKLLKKQEETLSQPLSDETANVEGDGVQPQDSEDVKRKNAWEALEKYLSDGTNKSIKKARLHNVIMIIVFSILAIGSAIGMYFLNNGIKDESFVKYFSSRFAHSLGGLEVSAIFFGIVLLIVLLAFVFSYCTSASRRIAMIMLIIVVSGQNVFYNYHLVRGDRYNPQRYSEMGSLIDYAEELEGNRTFRIKQGGDYLTADFPLTLNTNSVSVFSSVIDKANFVPTSFFGFGGNGVNTMRGYNGSALGDCLLGYKYLITNSSSARTYFKTVSGEKAKNGDYTLMVNQNCFESAFVVKSANIEKRDSHADQLDEILLFLSSGEYGASHSKFVDGNLVFDPTNEGVIRVKLMAAGAGNYYLRTNFPEEYQIEYCKTSWVSGNVKKLSLGETLQAGYLSGGYTSYLLRRTDGVELTKQDIIDYCEKVYVTDATLAELAEYTRTHAGKVTLLPGRIEVDVFAGAGQSLFVNYICLNGHSVTVNGKSAKLKENALNYMIVDLVEGQNHVVISYNSPYIKYGLVGLVAALLLVAIYVVATLKFKKLLQKLSPLVYWAAIGLSVLIMLFFFVMPTAVCTYKCTKSVILAIKALF